MDCGHYVSDVFDSSTGIWWHCDDNNITEISDLPKGVYYRRTHKPTKKRLMQGSTYVLFVVYIRTSHLTKHRYNVYQEFKTMSKSTLTKKVIEDQNVFRSEVMVRQEVNDGTQRRISYIKDDLQNSIENNLLEPKKKGK